MKKLIMIVTSTLATMSLFQFSLISGNSIAQSDLKFSRSLKPKVSLNLAGSTEKQTWGRRVRYRIQVQDQVDGNSKYSEINPSEVFLSIRFFPEARDSADIVNEKEMPSFSNSEGLTLMGKGACFGCHGGQTSKLGPSFKEIANSVDQKNSSKTNLVNSIRNGSVGKWGDKEMPSNPQYSKKEARKMAEFILEQGGCQYCWLYPGLEGVFQIAKKPNNVDVGLYLLTASYTSSNGELGKDSMVLKIR